MYLLFWYFIKNSLRIKNEQLKSLKILIEKEFENNKEIELNKKLKQSELNKQKLKQMRHKMQDVSKKQFEKNKKLDMKEKNKEIKKLRKQSEHYEKIFHKHNILYERHKHNE